MASFLNPIFSPFLLLHPFVAILFLSFIVSLIITLIYMVMTDQPKMKSIKKKLKSYQKEMKEHKKDPEKMMKIQKESMKVNMDYMKRSMKPTFVTFIPIMLIFWWMSANLAYLPLAPDEPFNVTAEIDKNYVGSVDLRVLEGQEGLRLISDTTVQPQNNKAEWILEGKEGIYTFEVAAGSSRHQKRIIITGERRYESVEERFSDSPIKKLIVGNQRIQPMQDIPLLGSIPWIGGFGWLGTYILLSIIFSISLRKLFKLH